MRATVRMELRNGGGDLIESRFAKNSVMAGGAALVANLFCGKAAAAITHMGVGISAEPETDSFATKELKTTGDSPDAIKGATETAIAPSDFTITTDEAKRLVIVRLHATLPKTAAVGTLREAGLLSRAGDARTLYNRVTFAPIAKGNDHELTLFWEVTFPYGDLNWM